MTNPNYRPGGLMSPDTEMADPVKKESGSERSLSIMDIHYCKEQMMAICTELENLPEHHAMVLESLDHRSTLPWLSHVLNNQMSNPEVHTLLSEHHGREYLSSLAEVARECDKWARGSGAMREIHISGSMIGHPQIDERFQRFHDKQLDSMRRSIEQSIEKLPQCQQPDVWQRFSTAGPVEGVALLALLLRHVAGHNFHSKEVYEWLQSKDGALALERVNGDMFSMENKGDGAVAKDKSDNQPVMATKESDGKLQLTDMDMCLLAEKIHCQMCAAAEKSRSSAPIPWDEDDMLGWATEPSRAEHIRRLEAQLKRIKGTHPSRLARTQVRLKRVAKKALGNAKQELTAAGHMIAGRKAAKLCRGPMLAMLETFGMSKDHAEAWLASPVGQGIYRLILGAGMGLLPIPYLAADRHQVAGLLRTEGFADLGETALDTFAEPLMLAMKQAKALSQLTDGLEDLEAVEIDEDDGDDEDEVEL